MDDKRDLPIGVFTQLDEKLSGFGTDSSSNEIIDAAMTINPWFTRRDIINSIEAIRTEMLDPTKLREWFAIYRNTIPYISKNVGIIMAGNIPLVGFFDLLCVIISGNSCFYKPSSKDSPLINYLVGLLREIWPEIPAYIYIGQPLDAVIATGSDNTNIYFRSRFGHIPALLRGSRASAAILTGEETDEELNGLSNDIFAYSGLGCRNISHLLVPAGYDFSRLISIMNSHELPSPKYRNNFVQRRAILHMRKKDFKEGNFFIIRANNSFPAYISEITYQTYSDKTEIEAWLMANDSDIQCVISKDATHPRKAEFGRSQSPSLLDYPDGKDVMVFLCSL